MEVGLRAQEKPHEDETCADRTDVDIDDEKRRAVGKECLARFHADAVDCGCHNGEESVL